MAQEKLTKFTQDEIMREQALAREKYQRDMLSCKCALEEAAEIKRKALEDIKEAAEIKEKAAETEKKIAETEKRIRDIARKLIASGYSLEEATDFTGLPIDEVAQLQ